MPVECHEVTAIFRPAEMQSIGKIQALRGAIKRVATSAGSSSDTLGSPAKARSAAQTRAESRL
ncbi:hypothetical protein [Bradyrhizobium sp.]|uniref:hypothetical protein n=1 Tax=Bradyrhizobium sp. TaxID=376 RepID=UPI002DF79070|nr:hypothetical protein [Bradyrhizobium sp.]